MAAREGRGGRNCHDIVRRARRRAGRVRPIALPARSCRARKLPATRCPAQLVSDLDSWTGRSMLRTACCALAFLASAAALSAQSITGTLTGAAGEPVSGALVTLLREDGTAARATVSRAAGQFALHASDTGRFRISVERPGFLPYRSDWFELGPETDLTRPFAVATEPSPIGAVRAAAGACTPGTTFGTAAALWQRATLSLGIMALAEEAELLDVIGVRYLRVLDTRGELQEGVIEQEPFAAHAVPYPAPPVSHLPGGGFVSIDSAGTLQYQLPTPAILLSPVFLQNHCIGGIVLDRQHADQVGLAIRPGNNGRGVGIEGVLWLDRGSAQVREVEFEYRDPARSLPRGARGEIGFRVGGEGVPQVSRWWVRVPREFETRYSLGITARSGSRLESGAFVFGKDDRPLEDPDGVFALLGQMFSIGPIVVEAERAQLLMSEGAQKQIRLDEIRGGPPTDAWDIVRTLRPNWIARAESPALAEGAAHGELVVYLDRMRLSTLNGDPDVRGYTSAEAALSQVPVAWIASIEYIPPIEAAAIYGLGHGYGVVVIRSRRQ
ncbi:MAG: carboxypeptidase regulatory-like domain-containing protein [Gemmatimonadetes bacterium]|nr:carboxypeptidase regulatory-like domain-containing protein [Gemmatimonadota bacterium]